MSTPTPFQHSKLARCRAGFLLAVTLLVVTGIQAGSSQTAAAIQQSGELLIAPFASGYYGGTSSHAYSGTVTLTVSGIGQSSGAEYTDAFYKLTDSYGNPIDPYYPADWVLSINTQLAVNFIPGGQVPAYRPDHTYTFDINAPGGYLTFGVWDEWVIDNHGSYIIEISRTSSCEVPFFSQRDPRWIEHPLRTDGGCLPYCEHIGTCGCTLTSATMLFDYYGANLLPPDLSNCMGTKACPFYWFSGALCSQDYATWSVNYKVSFSWTWLDQQLNQSGRPVLLGMHRGDNKDDAHWVLVISGHGDNPDGYLAHDPWPLNGANTSLATLVRENYNFDWLVIYDGQPGCSRASSSLTTAPSPLTPAVEATA